MSSHRARRWGIRVEQVHCVPGCMPLPPARYFLDDLELTLGQGLYLVREMGSRGRHGYTWEWPRYDLFTISSIELTRDEADAITAGASPLDVLVPRPLRVRTLTEAELLAL